MKQLKIKNTLKVIIYLKNSKKKNLINFPFNEIFHCWWNFPLGKFSVGEIFCRWNEIQWNIPKPWNRFAKLYIGCETKTKFVCEVNQKLGLPADQVVQWPEISSDFFHSFNFYRGLKNIKCSILDSIAFGTIFKFSLNNFFNLINLKKALSLTAQLIAKFS
jgi:hypothetical protein